MKVLHTRICTDLAGSIYIYIYIAIIVSKNFGLKAAIAAVSLAGYTALFPIKKAV